LNGPYSANQKYHPSHNGHVKIDLSKMMEWSFWHLSKFKLGIFVLYLLVQKAKNYINLCHFMACYIRFFEHLRTKLNVVKEIDGFKNVDT